MNIDLEIIKALELKLAKYSKTNAAIAEHISANMNCNNTCMATCSVGCTGTCKYVCDDGCTTRIKH